MPVDVMFQVKHMAIYEDAMEKTKIYGKTVHVFAEYNTKVLNAWNSFWAAQH